MYIGYLGNEAKYAYYHAGSNVPCPPTVTDGVYRWSWKEIYDVGIDVKVKLGGKCFVGSVTLPLAVKSRVKAIKVLDGNKLLGSYTAETNKTAAGRITVAVGAYAKELTIRILANLNDVAFTEPEIAICREDDAPLLWPEVKSLALGEGSVSVGVICTKEKNEDEIFAAEFFGERLSERFGSCLSEDGVAATIVKDDSYESGRYTVEVTEDGITVTAGARIDLLYAVCKLVELCEGGKFRVCRIDDKPTKELRGFHFGLPKSENVEFMKRLFRYVLLPLGYNTLFVEFCGGMRFDRHPEISEAWLDGNEKALQGLQPKFPHDYMGAEGTLIEKAEVSDMLDCARAYGFEIIPEVQSLGHVQYITYAHPELAEREEVDKDVSDTRVEDERPSNFYTHCYCPSNEDSYKLIFDIIDEIVEVAKPQRYVHIGHDEVYHLGLCKRCREVSHDVLYARHVNRLYDYLKSKGLGTALWSDMMQPVTKYQTPNAINLVPKDVLCLDFIWYFHLDKDIEENLLEKGFKVGIGNLYSSHFPRYKKRILTDGVLGGEVSTWCSSNEYRLGKKGKMWDLTYTAQMLWNPEAYDENMREVYSNIISKYIQPVQRDELHEKFRPKGYRAKAIALPEGDKRTIPAAILGFRPEAILANGAQISVGVTCDRLAIEHTTLNPAPRIPWEELYLCGQYTVRYEDGEEQIIRAEYMGNVQHYDAIYGDPKRGDFYRHTGYVGTWFSDPTLEERTESERVLLTSYVWENPNPKKKIASISYKSEQGDYTTLVLTGVKALTKK